MLPSVHARTVSNSAGQLPRLKSLVSEWFAYGGGMRGALMIFPEFEKVGATAFMKNPG